MKSVQLKSISEDDIVVEEMEYKFAYKRIKQPNGNNSPYFSVHYIEKGNPVWETLNGLLHEDFTVCKTVDVIDHIKTQLNSDVIAEKHWRHKTFVKSTFMLKGFDFGTSVPEDADTLIFKLLTGIDLPEIEKRTGLVFHIINGFSGNLALQLNYGFITTHLNKDENGKILNRLSVSNIFVMEDFSTRLVHDNSFKLKYDEIDNIKNECQSKVDEYKKIELDLSFFEILTKDFPKKMVKSFLNIFDELPVPYKNLLYATYIFSFILEQKRNINMETKLRNFVTGYVSKYKLQQIKNKTV